MSVVYPSLGIDLDGCVDEFPIFFQLLTQYWPGKVYVITFRADKEKAISDLKSHNIRFDEVVLVKSLESKGDVIVDLGIMVYIDDQPEALKNIPLTVGVMLMRNEGNFDFDNRRWIMSNSTGRLI